jgi:hypothetical protein
MEMMSETAQIVNQLKKLQGETNQRLDTLIAELRSTNELLASLTTEVAERLPPAGLGYAGTTS